MELIVRRVLAGAVMLMFISTMVCLPSGIAQAAQYSQNHDDEQDAGVPGDDEAWADDITGKIDTTIKVLSVIREEVEEAEKERLDSRVDDADSNTAMARNAARWISRINRAWRNMMKATAGDERVTPDGTVPHEESDVIDSAAISGRLSTAIDMMSAIREELEKEQKKEKEED